MRRTSMPTIPNAPVKTRSRKLLPNVEKGLTQPPRLAATREFVQTLSTTKGGEVLFAYPQHLSSCWIKLCVDAGWVFHTTSKFFLVLSVSNQMERPRTMVYSAQTTARYPWNFNQPRDEGITIAGTETKNVKKTRMAFPMAARNGHCSRIRLRAAVVSVGVWSVSFCIIKAKTIKSPPDTTNSMSDKT